MSLEPKFFAGKIRPQMQHSNIYISHFKNEKEKKAIPEELGTTIYKFIQRISSCLHLLTLFLLYKSPLS